MRNAAELALSEFNSPDIQLLVKDDGGTGQGAQAATQQALDEGAEIILGPLFATAVGPAGQTARARNVPVIAFSTDANVAARGVYLLSFLPESDVDRIIGYAAGQGKRSFAALVPDNAYGTVVEAAFKSVVAKRGGRVVALERYPLDKSAMQGTVRNVAAAASKGADAIFIADSADGVATAVQTLAASGIDTKKMQLLGTGLWEDAQIFSNPALDGAWYAGPDSTGFRNFSGRYRTKYGQDPVRTASLAYDAVALVAALVKTQGKQRFATEVLTNASGFTGIDGLFRFRPDGTNQRGLAVLRVSPTGGQIVSPPPKGFTGQGT
jgi:ABC-type branched-subunit amino acid transport system substrate-binding protein